MSRVEKGAAANAQMEAMRGEMLRTVRRGSGGRGKAGCALALLAALLAVAAFACWLVTATGLAAVPGFSAAYRAPAPDHAVAAGAPIEAVVNGLLGDALTARLREGRGTLQDRAIALTLPESAFTASLRQALARTDQSVIDPERAQAAVAGEALELFLPFKDNPRGSALVVRLSFAAKDGGLEPAVAGVRLGALALPDFLVEAAIQPAVRQSLAPFSQELNRYAALRAVTFVPGAVRLEADLTVDVLHLP